jgi:hypothetical protein
MGDVSPWLLRGALWGALALGTAVLTLVGAELFSGLNFPWFAGGALGLVVGIAFSLFASRRRERAILPVMNAMVSFMVIFQALYFGLVFMTTGTGPYIGLVTALVLILIFAVTFNRPHAVPLWVLCHEVLNLAALIVVSFSWFYWYESSWHTPCMNWSMTRTDSVYFTLTTLATVGYGDFRPVSETCRQVVSLQIVIGFIFAGLVIALLVTRIGQASNSPAE